MRKIVISGVNLVSGGTLSVFRDCILEFSKRRDFAVICLVHSKSLFSDMFFDNVEYIEFPQIKASWISRLKFEYFTCKKISNDVTPDIWLSMHDITPRVDTDNLFVYCHNPTPFYSATYLDLRFDRKQFLFSLFYKYLYRINIKNNKAVIVQQGWIGEYFKEKLKARKIIVAKPVNSLANSVDENYIFNGKLNLFYPALPRTFKNFELLLDALSYLKINNFKTYSKIELVLTIHEDSNSYSRYLINKYSHLENVSFVGLLSRKEVESHYKSCDIVIFPSKLETWGLPISEAKAHGKPIILSNLPYAHETLGDYPFACFVDPDDPVELSSILCDVCENKNIFHHARFDDLYEACYSWSSLVDTILLESNLSI